MKQAVEVEVKDWKRKARRLIRLTRSLKKLHQQRLPTRRSRYVGMKLIPSKKNRFFHAIDQRSKIAFLEIFLCRNRHQA